MIPARTSKYIHERIIHVVSKANIPNEHKPELIELISRKCKQTPDYPQATIPLIVARRFFVVLTPTYLSCFRYNKPRPREGYVTDVFNSDESLIPLAEALYEYWAARKYFN